ncbi:uncharacterized protein EDB91DRAFT_1249196 [Suillus paluster]|uniref:uncharacterized protein n=1 Tax=Suillus paluster TaxID=48578 RepID=UPI001B86DEA4|nr:uncharacterized protein EDB91DRAFT_1249196 [Suillus paluster]KAG1738658.1 hypothetical protein EDB91DRAFT_1249196 [Suillus paluster]
MSSTAPTCQALGNIVNNTDSAPSQRQHRECRPSEKALYQVEEDQEFHEAHHHPSGQDKTKATCKNCVNRGTQDSTQFSMQAITQSKGSVAANGPLDLWPRFSKEDTLTKESSFVNGEHRSNSFSLPPAPQNLTDIDLTDSEQYDDNDNDPINHDVDKSDVFTGGENDLTDLCHLKCVRLPHSDDEGYSTQSHKWMHKSEDSPSLQQGEQQLPCKIHQSKGHVAAQDYEVVAVQQLIKFVISHFCVQLASEYAYPDHMTQVLWAKEAWKEACSSYEIDMGFNGEIIQMITHRTLHLTSKVKRKVCPLVKNIYGFKSTNRESIKSRNRKLTCQLKDKFGLCYQDLGDKKNNIPHSGLFRSRLNQQAENLLWYCNKKNEGIVFEKFFSPFPIPALALVYTTAECCIDEWYDGKRVDISFSSSEYREAYDMHLVNLKKFHTQMKDQGILDGILAEFNNNGRLHAKVDPINIGDRDCLSDDKINNMIQEYQQVGGTDDSDKVESDWESEGGQFEDDEVEAKYNNC